MKRTFILIGLLGWVAGTCFGQERRDVLVQVMRVKVSDEAVVAEVLGRVAANDEALYRRVEALLGSGGATVEGLTSVRVPSGQRAKGNAQWLSVEPTEYEVDHETRRVAPIATETWAFGPQLEIDPTVSKDGTMVELNLAVSHGAGKPVEIPVRVGLVKGSGGTLPTMVSRTMPLDRCSTGSIVASGERVLISAMRRVPLITDGGGGNQTELLLTFLRATAADPAVPSGPSVALNAPARIGVEVAVFEVGAAAAAALTWRRGEGGSDEANYGEMMSQVAGGKAKLVALNYVSSRSGNRAKVERASEYVYPAEFELPLVAPTAWENRRVGQVLEVDPVLSVIRGTNRRVAEDPFGGAPKAGEGEHVVSVNFAWEDVGLAKASEYRFDLKEARNSVDRPTFRSERLTTAALLGDGGARLAGVVQAAGDGGTRLIFLKALQVAEQPRGRAAAGGSQILMKTLVIGVPKATAGQIGGVAGGGKAQAILGDLLERVATGGAEVVSQAGVLTRTGQRAKVEAVDEVIYPTEYEKGGSDRIWYPSAFETQNVGSTFMVEPVLKPGGEVIQAGVLLECDTAPLEMATLEKQVEALATGGAAIEPGVNQLRLSQQVELRSGGVALVHVGDAKGVAGRVDYVFVTGEVK